VPTRETTSEISRNEADNLLHRLISESVKVLAVFMGRGSITAAITGFVSSLPSDMVGITEGKKVGDSSLSFSLTDVSSFQYGNRQAFPRLTSPPGAPGLMSALSFVYPDGSQVVLFEVGPLIQ
jgi:hypothetical protein